MKMPSQTLSLSGYSDLGFGFDKIFFYVEAFVHESNIEISPPPTCLGHAVAILLHDHWAV